MPANPTPEELATWRRQAIGYGRGLSAVDVLRLIDALEAAERKVRDLGQALTDIKQDVAENYRPKGY